MPKKRVGVSLRKPSPAPEAAAEPVATPNELVAPDVVARTGSAAIDSAAMSDITASERPSDVAPSERPSDIVALRESPAPEETKAIEAFVNGAAEAFEKAATELPPARLAEVLRRGPEGYRELVLYLPEKLAQDLSMHCLEHNLDMSRLVAAAIEQHLTGVGVGASVSVTAPVGVSAHVENRRADDVAPSNEGLLSLAARVLMSELAAWARAVWARRRAAGGPVSAGVAG
jgi:hypothetical protein